MRNGPVRLRCQACPAKNSSVRGWTVEGKKLILCGTCASAMKELIMREKSAAGVGMSNDTVEEVGA